MNEVAEIDLDEIWSCASFEASQRAVDLARKVLKGSAAYFASSDPTVVRFSSDPSGLLAAEPDAARGFSRIDATLRLSSGRVIGFLEIVDASVRLWTDEDRDILSDLTACLTCQIELRIASLQREKAEAALDLARTHLLAVADRIPGLVFERRKIDAGRSRYTFFGSTKSQLPAVRSMMADGGTGTLNFVHRDDREIVRAAILRSNIEETDLDLTFRVKDFEHRVRWLRSQSIVRRDTDGTVFWDGLIFDISDLVAARDDAEAAHAAKDKLLVEIDHELRSPLQAIVELANDLTSERPPGQTVRRADDIQAAAASVLAIIGKLRDRAGAQATHIATAPGAPRSEPPIEAAGERPGNAVGQTAASTRAESRILLADDLDLNRKLIADMLGLEGYTVECAANGEEAVQMASRQRFDLILMDMVMPVMNGPTATKAIRALPAPACNVPIVALTAHSMDEELDACLKAGMNATLTKPMSIDALNSAVEAWIGRRTEAA